MHVVFVTNYRRGMPGAGMPRCYQDAMRKAFTGFGAELQEFNDQDDHVHPLVDYPPNVAIFALVNSLKDVPVRRLRSELTGRVNRYITYGHFRSPSYLAASCGDAPPATRSTSPPSGPPARRPGRPRWPIR